MADGEVRSSDVEAYKLAVEMADRVSARRAVANAFFVTVNSAMTVLCGAIGTQPSASSTSNQWFALVAGVGGVIICSLWWALIRSYQLLNKAKFEVIAKLESSMGIAVFIDEWRLLQGSGVKYRPLGAVERVIPVIFSLLYVTLAVRSFF